MKKMNHNSESCLKIFHCSPVNNSYVFLSLIFLLNVLKTSNYFDRIKISIVVIVVAAVFTMSRTAANWTNMCETAIVWITSIWTIEMIAFNWIGGIVSSRSISSISRIIISIIPGVVAIVVLFVSFVVLCLFSLLFVVCCLLLLFVCCCWLWFVEICCFLL